MSLCPTCQSEIAAGLRWCSLCHVNVLDPEVGKLASPGSRFAAHFLDGLIPVMALFAVIGAAAAVPDFAVLVILVLALGYIAWALKLFAHGTTPGKNALGLRVMKEGGQTAGFGTMLFREWIGKWISGLLFGLGFFWILFDAENQGWHDKLASTYVVKTARAVRPVPAMAGASTSAASSWRRADS